MTEAAAEEVTLAESAPAEQEAPVVETVEEQPAESTPAPAEEEAAPAPAEAKPPRDERIDKYYKTQAELDATAREAQALREELDRIRQASIPAEAPTLESCGYDEDAFAKQTLAYSEAQAEAKARQRLALEQQTREWNEVVTSFNAASQRYEEENAGHLQRIATAGYTQDVGNAVMKLNDPQLADHLAQNQSLLNECNQLSGIDLGVKLAKIQNEMTKKPPKLKTSAPAPVETVGAGGSVPKNTPPHIEGVKFE